MTTTIKETILRYSMLNKGDEVIAAVSGGADSVALLYALYLLKEELSITLSACHVNHCLRGAESDADEEYVSALCEKLGVPLTVRRVDIKAMLKKHQSVEECARDARYAFFAEISESKKLATAHTASDNAETVLFNLTRGTGLKGLCGIPPVRDNIIRPLLSVTREETESFCDVNNLRYVTDNTNFSEEYSRNKIRLSVIPRLREINPSLPATIARMTGLLAEDESFLSDIASSEINAALREDGYDAEYIHSLPVPIRSRVIARLLNDESIEPSALRINMITQILTQKRGKINLEKDRFAVVRKNRLTIVKILQNYRKKL